VLFAKIAAFLLPLEVKRKTAGKNSLPFHEEVLQQLIPNDAISALPYRPQAERLEVVVFQRAGAESVAAGQREAVTTHRPQV
jgi:hypothetical protein